MVLYLVVRYFVCYSCSGERIVKIPEGDQVEKFAKRFLHHPDPSQCIKTVNIDIECI